MKIHEFIKQFPDENSSRIHFKKVREKQGVTCKKCSGTEHYWLKNKWQWQCKQCSFRTTLRSGTSMQYANLPLYKWYLCMALMTATKKGISAKEMQRQLGHNRYRTIWELMQKLRATMASSDDIFFLEDIMKIESSDFGARRSMSNTNQSKKSTRLNYAIMESLQRKLDGYTNRKPKHSMSKSTSKTQIDWILEHHTLVPGFAYFFKTMLSYQSRSSDEQTSMGWIGLLEDNARRNIFGVYHRVSTKFLQNYLSEFCFRLNRRFFGEGRFDSLVLAVEKCYCGTIATTQ